MGRVSEAHFEGKEVARVCLEAALKEAKQIEAILTLEKIDYFVELENLLTGTGMLATSPAQGVAFYVTTGQAEVCKELLVEAVFRQTVVDD